MSQENSEEREPIAESWSETRYPTAVINNDWVVRNFKLRTEENGDMLCSPQFTGGPPVCRTTWAVHLYPKGRDRDSSEHLSIYVALTHSNASAVRASFRFSVLRARRGVGRRLTSKFVHVFRENCSLGFRKFLPLALLDTPTTSLLPRGNLTIYTEVSLFPDTLDSVQFETDCYSLSRDLGLLVDEARLSDFTFIVGDTEFKAHKVILEARSEVFAAMMRYDGEDKAVIAEMSPAVFREMLTFIYTGKAPNVDCMADKLLVAADKYLLDDLRTLCEKSLYARLTVEGATETLILAHHYSVGGCLKNAVISFIVSHARDVLRSSGWHKLQASSEYSDLASQIIEKIEEEDESLLSDDEGPPRKRCRFE